MTNQQSSLPPCNGPTVNVEDSKGFHLSEYADLVSH
jgi:hypothetical protein